MLWRRFGREVTPSELFTSVQTLLAATRDFLDCDHQRAGAARSILGAHPA